VYFAADLYHWWLEHQKEYERYALFDEWAERGFAKKTVIPMYRRLRDQERERREE
jgi:hypothetical protein